MAKDCTSILRAVRLLLLLLKATQALRWTSVAHNGENSLICKGGNFTFPWTYVTENDDKITVLFWFSDKRGSFASYFADTFTSSSSRVTFNGNAKMTLSDVREEDDDTYGVSIRLYDKAESFEKYARLTVVEPPETRDGEIHLTELSHNSSRTGNMLHLHTRLKCGEFLSLGLPPVSVTWTDPRGRRLPSSSFADGFFYLDLPPYAKGGNYTCSLDPKDEEATKCLPSDSPLRMEVSFLVETMETEIRDQAEDLQELNTELTDLKEKTLGFKLVDTNLLRIQELTGRVDELEAKGDNLTEATESQKLLDDARDKTQQESLQSLHDTMNDLKEKTHQEVQAGLDNLNNKLKEMTQTLTQHQTTDTQHSSSIDDILRRLNDVEKASERQTIVNGNLQNELSKLQEVSEQQKITISSLEQEIAEIKKADEALKTANGALSQTLEDVQASSHTEHEELREKTNILTSRLNNEQQTRANSSATLKNQLEAISETLTLNTEQQNLKFSGLQQEITELQEAKEQLITVNRTLSLQLEEVQASCHTEHEELREKTTILTNRLQTEERTRANSSATMKNQLEAISETLTLNREQQNLTFSGLQQEITELQEADEAMKTANKTLRVKLEGVQASSQALYEELREKTNRLTNRVQTEERTRANSSTVLQNQLDAISQTLTLNTEQQDLKFSGLQQEITELQKASEELITVNRTLTLQLEDVQASTQAFYEELREKTNRLTNRVQTEERIRANSSATVQNQLNGISHTLTLNTHQQNVKVSALQQEITELKEADEALKTANETLNQRLEDVQTSSEASYEELREKTNILTNRVQMEEQTRARSSTQLQTRLDELTASQQESIRDLREKSERLKSGHDNLTQVLQDDTETLRGLVTEQHTLKEKSKRCEEDYQVLSQTTEGFQDTLSELTQRLHNEQQTRANSAALHTMVSGLSEMLTDLRSTARTKQAATDSQLSQVKQNLASLTTSSHDAVSRLGDVEDQLGRLHQSVSANITQVMQTVTRGGEITSSVEETVRSLRSSVSQGQTTLSTLQGQFGQLQTLSSSLRSSITTVNNRLDSAVLQINQVRLVGGASNYGRVEVRVGFVWGTVCDDNWDTSDARVICRMLGLSTSSVTAYDNAQYGQGTGPIVLDDVACTGSENNIIMCRSRQLGEHNCAHSEDASVRCG